MFRQTLVIFRPFKSYSFSIQLRYSLLIIQVKIHIVLYVTHVPVSLLVLWWLLNLWY